MQLLRVPLHLLAAFLLFEACNKPNDVVDTDSGGSRLKSTTAVEKERAATRFRIFYHAANGRLERVVDSMAFRTDNNTLVTMDFPTTIDYDAAGRVQQITSRQRLGNDAIYNLWQYDADGKPTVRIYISELERDTVTHYYSYDSGNRLIKDSLFNNKNKRLVEYTVYTYDARDNVVEWNRYSNAFGTLVTELKAVATYDQNPNPYRSVGSTVYTYWYFNFGRSRNNPLTIVYSDGTKETYQYQYYSNGLPRSAVKSVSAPRYATRENILYAYE